MFHAVPVREADDQRRFCALPGFSAINTELIARQCPDESWLLLDQSDQVVARCSLWWSRAPSLEGHRLGLVGHYAAREPDAAAEVLRLACKCLTERGCSLAVGPMDGNTWQRYRLMTDRGSEPIFFLEPDNADDWPAHFTASGFTALAEYYSAVNTDLGHADRGLDEIERQASDHGITLRSLELNRFEDELRAIHALSLLSFRENFLYTAIDVDDFIAQYRGIRPYIRPELVLVAERARQAVGFLFIVPDILQAERGQSIDTVIFKTVAVHPDHAGMGLGRLLIGRGHAAAYKLGYRRAIHALMHEKNRSRRISGHSAHVIRRYTLFARPLGGPA
jgi:GNAT superfamily N-acetyltransferase